MEQPTGLLPTYRRIIIVAHVAIITFFTSFSSGLITIGFPVINKDLKVGENMLPTSIYYTTSGASLLLAGTVADAVGARRITLIGELLLGLTIAVCGVVKNEAQLIAVRAVQGIAMAMSFPTAVSIVSNSLPVGLARNVGFSCMAVGMPLGFMAGLLVGGELADTRQWRLGYNIAGGCLLGMRAIGPWTLPKDNMPWSWPSLRASVDWLGGLLIAVALATLLYGLATLAKDSAKIKQPLIWTLFALSLAFLGLFVWWVSRREEALKPALVPISLWRNLSFTSICGMVFLNVLVVQSIEMYSSLFFQNVKHVEGLGTAFRIIPGLVLALFINIGTGFFANRLPPRRTILIATAISALAPLLMALIKPTDSYWRKAFPAQVVMSLGGDIVFTLGMIVISDIFSADKQAIAAAILTSFSQLGSGVGLLVMSTISHTTVKHFHALEADIALWEGYRAAFVALLGAVCLAFAICFFGLKSDRKA